MTKTTRSKNTSSRRNGVKSKPRNSRRQANTSNKAPLWAWLVIGLLVAALITLLLFLANQQDAPQPPPVSKTPTKAPAPTPQPRFDFYEILKEREITVPDRSAEIRASIPDDIDYFLQAGSFRSDKEADKLRAELLLSNMAAHIEPSSRNGQTWYRVITGPFASRSKMAKARSLLASRGMSPLLLKRKKQ